jgi:hypothetical protein
MLCISKEHKQQNNKKAVAGGAHLTSSGKILHPITGANKFFYYCGGRRVVSEIMQTHKHEAGNKY